MSQFSLFSDFQRMSHSGEVSTITIMDFGEGAGKNHSLDRFSKSLGNFLEKSSRQHLLQCRLVDSHKGLHGLLSITISATQ